MLLDSTFINDLVRGRADAERTLNELIDRETPVTLSSLTVFEVGFGLRGEAKQHRQGFSAVVDEIETAALGVAETRRALSIQRDLYAREKPIGAVDVLIAGTAAERGGSVLTRNVEEFERVDAIDVETY